MTPKYMGYFILVIIFSLVNLISNQPIFFFFTPLFIFILSLILIPIMLIISTIVIILVYTKKLNKIYFIVPIYDILIRFILWFIDYILISFKGFEISTLNLSTNIKAAGAFIELILVIFVIIKIKKLSQK